jgi:hypothetical protein
MFYRYKISLIIEEIQKHKENPDFWQGFHALKEKYSISPGYYRTVLLNLDQTDMDFIHETAGLLGLDFKKYLEVEKPYLTSHQIRELIQKGFTFGGHSIDHPKFDRLPENEIIRQAIKSTGEICTRFDLDYRVFAFPFTDYGIKKSFFDAIYADNQVELSYGTSGIKQDSEYRNLQRIPMEEFGLSAACRLRTKYFIYLIKSLFGKNSINRH